MEDPIDLRRYLRSLAPFVKWILVVTAVAGIAAFTITLLLPKTYQATALVIVTTPRYELIDGALGEVADIQIASNLYPEIALSDSVVALLEELLAQNSAIPEARLREMLAATSGRDPGLVKLTVESREALEAARVANTWAQAFVTHMGELVGTRGSQVAFLEAQLPQAEARLAQAEETLVAWKATDTRALLANELAAYTEQHAATLLAKGEIARLMIEAEGLQELAASQVATGALSSPNAVAALLLQMRAFSDPAAEGSPPLQLQIDSTALRADLTPAELLAFANGLMRALAARVSDIDAQMAALEPQILEKQAEIQRLDAEARRLEGALELAETQQRLLASKLEETRTAAANTAKDVQWASSAGVPSAPSGPSVLMNTAVAIIAALFCGVLVASLLIWWRGSSTQK